MSVPLLDVENPSVTFPTRQGEFEAVRGVSFTLGRERLGIVGEGGSGKAAPRVLEACSERKTLTRCRSRHSAWGMSGKKSVIVELLVPRRRSYYETY